MVQEVIKAKSESAHTRKTLWLQSAFRINDEIWNHDAECN